MNETTERFFQDIAGRIGHERIVEVHLFPAIKQGWGESGLAVVAARPDSVPAGSVERHVVYTARYRHTLKGVERGRWEVEVTAEADAPLTTVDEVVRGVVRRYGGESPTERITAEQFREIVSPPVAAVAEPASAAPHDTQPLDSDPV